MYRKEIGFGFFEVTSREEATTQKIFMLTPHISKWGTCIMQPWIVSFNACRLTSTKMPILITLKDVRGNPTNYDKKFYIVVEMGKPFILTIGAENQILGLVSLVQIDYNNLPIRCKMCLSMTHLIKDCNVLGGKVSNKTRSQGHFNRKTLKNTRVESIQEGAILT